MCGLAGFSYLKGLSTYQKWMLVESLGAGIDTRGGHAIGYVSAVKGRRGHQVAKVLGRWSSSRPAFTLAAAKSDVSVMHSRYATCGAKEDVHNAHPFVIRRNDRAVLYGAHNGVLTGTYSSAAMNKRKHSVDSRELFELLADNDMKAFQAIEGYGAITWMVPGSDVVHLAKLSDDASLVVATIKTGGVVWASTKTILEDALKKSDLELDTYWNIDEVGRVFWVSADGVFSSERTGVKVATRTAYKWAGDYGGWDDDTDGFDYGAYTGGTNRYVYRGMTSRTDHGYGTHLYWNKDTSEYETADVYKARTAKEDKEAEEAWIERRLSWSASANYGPKEAAKDILAVGSSGLTTAEAANKRDGRIHYDVEGSAYITTLNGETWMKAVGGVWTRLEVAANGSLVAAAEE